MPPVVVLREIADPDLPVFFAHQQEPGANHMAAFMPRDPADRAAFDAHWAKLRADPSVIIRTVLLDGRVAGNVASFERSGKREVCYWIGREFWGRGLATAALSQFLTEVPARPLYAGVAADNVASIRVLENCGFSIVGREWSFAKARGAEIEELVLRLE